MSFFLIVPNWLKAIDLPIVSNLKIYQTVYCMLIPSYVLTNKSFADILTGYTSIYWPIREWKEFRAGCDRSA